MTQRQNDMSVGSMSNTAKPNDTSDYLRPQGSEDLREKAQHVAGDVQEKAQHVAGDVQEKAAQLGDKATDQINSAMTSAGQQLNSLAQTVREKAPDGQIRDLAANTAGALERSASYLENADLNAVRGDLESIIRKHPVESVVVGLGVGFLLARSMRR